MTDRGEMPGIPHVEEDRWRYPREAIREWLASGRGRYFANANDLKDLEDLVDAMFFASLATEEGNHVQLQVVFGSEGVEKVRRAVDTSRWAGANGEPPELAWHVLEFHKRRNLTVEALTKLAVGIDARSSAIMVCRESAQGTLTISGIARRNTRTNGGELIIISSSAPGSLSLFFNGLELFRYGQGRLSEPPARVIGKQGPVRTALEACVTGLTVRRKLGFGSALDIVENAVCDILSGLGAGGRGGLLALLPRAHTEFEHDHAKFAVKDSGLLVERIQAVFEAETRLWNASFSGEEDEEAAEEREYAREQLQRAREEATATGVELGRLGGVDNALLIAKDFIVVGAGYPILSECSPDVFLAADTLGEHRDKYPLELHGSRHRAAACFANDNPGALAFVVSADGPIKCFLRYNDQVVLWAIRLPGPWDN